MANSPNTKLLTVEDVFLIEGRGVVVMPMIDYNGLTSFAVVLRKPNGEELRAQALLEIPRRPPNNLCPFACLLTGISKQDVPIGTEIWIV